MSDPPATIDRKRGIAAFLSPPFLIAVGLLGATAILGGPIADWLKLVRHKAPLPLVKPLQEMDRNALGPYRVVEISILTPEELEALGTSDAISWWLRDTRPTEDDPSPIANVLVTYNTGAPSLVPHTPDRCYAAHGYRQAQIYANTEIDVTNLPQRLTPVPVRVLTFEKTGIFGGVEQSVVYTFFCNGRFTTSRNLVRSWTTNPFVRHAFFSKVEVSFADTGRDETVELAADLLSYVLPELLARHWPDFESAEEQADNGDARVNE